MKKFPTTQVSITPLAIFRILFGGIMLVSVIRFAANGWIEEQYLQPQFFFSYYGFEWIKHPGEFGIYALFAIMATSAVMIMLGCFYRVFSVLFFLSFTYVELIDKTNYLNHYYFISLVSFLLMLLPAHRRFSLDVLRKPDLKLTYVPRWTIFILQLQLGMVYFFAGLAKLNYDWMFLAQPMKIWLPSKSHLPLIGDLFNYVWVAYVFSWAGALYDLSIPFLLSLRKTRIFAYGLVIIFHVMTAMLFQIGMFPWIMILLTLIFFPIPVPLFEKAKLSFALQNLFKRTAAFVGENAGTSDETATNANYGSGRRNTRQKSKLTIFNRQPIIATILIVFFGSQILLPLRCVLYPDNLFWTEQGYRFSWRVMLMEKAGTCFFYVTDPATGKTDEVSPCDFLTRMQEKQMATQPDMILQFAHFLKEKYREIGIENAEVRVESYVTLNGRSSRLFIDPRVDLAQQKESFKHKDWILPFNNENEKLAAAF